MQWTITRKLFFALLIISLAILVMSAFFGRLSFQSGFNAYLEAREAPVLERLAADLAVEYQNNNGWQELRSNERIWRRLVQRAASGRPFGERGGRPPGRPAARAEGRAEGRFEGRPQGRPGPSSRNSPRRLGDRIGLFDLSGKPIAGRLPANTTNSSGEPGYLSAMIVVNAQNVAELRLLPAEAPSSELEIAFDEEQKRSLLWIALALLLLSGLASGIIARQFTRPIRNVADGTRALANGNYDEPIGINSNDELGALAADVNSLGRVLSSNREARRRWLGDINHELRTPITILNAELQSLEDGYRPFNADSVASLQSEVDRLAQLVDDLYSLSSSDEGQLDYQFSDFDVRDLLRQRLDAAVGRMKEKSLELTANLPDQPIQITADPTRIAQLFTNLIENSIRYTDSPGEIRVHCHATDTHLEFSIEDSAPGVPAGLHQQIFERLYRVESSRNRGEGGSGLGLSICEAIVKAHHGNISAQDTQLKGLRIDVQLPRTQQSKR